MSEETDELSAGVRELFESLDAGLQSLKDDYRELTLRAKVLRLVEILKRSRKLNVAIVRESGSDAADARRRLLLYLQANVGQVVHASELEVVGSISEYARRVRELRTEEGWAIATRFTGRPDLNGNEYVLESLDRVAEPHDRRISSGVQEEVYKRDNNTCQLCGGTVDHWIRAGSSMLELHHIQNHAAQGPNLASNLLVLCNVCHDDVHAGRLPLPSGLIDRVSE